jgi:uncharacterized membrane protein (UPF0182 family)
MTRQARIATWVALGVAGLVIVTVVVANILSNRLWFSSLGYGSVYDAQLGAKSTLFFGFGTAMGVLVSANIALGFALRPMLVGGPELTGLTRYRAFFAPIHRRSLIVVGALVGLGAGRIAAGHWQTLLMWRYGGRFGVSDPYFHHDAGFYVFDLPWWHFVTQFAMTGLIFSLVAATLVHYLYGGLRLQPVDRHLSHAAGAHIAGLGAAILLLKALQTWLGRYDLVTRPGDTFSGMSYVGYHSMLPGQTLLAWLAVVCGVLLLIAAWRTQWLLSSVAIGLYAVAILGVGVIWPAAMRSASVQGQEITAEKSFVPKNIEATRVAYGLTDVASVRLPATAPVIKKPESNAQVQAVRTDLQRASTSLGLLTRAEVGYYPIGGKQTELVLGLRRVGAHHEFSAAFANPAGAAAAKTTQTWWTAAQLAQYLGVKESSIAVDPTRTGYAVVSALGDTHGFSLSSWWTRAAAAIRYADPNLLKASGRLADLRQPLQRAQQLAPWLTLDSQMYPAVVKGRVVWILDGYTTSSTYPESQVASLSAMTTDAQNPRPTFGSLVGDNINYIRDSVKVVVDASTGGVTFYAWDESDPILKAMRAAFPGLVQPKTSMSPQLASVMRYPTTLFSVQRAMLASYRVTNPTAFLAARGRWQVAADAQSPDVAAAATRGLIENASGALVPTLSTTYTDATDATVAGFLVANSDIGSPDFGKLELQVLPQNPVIVGPSVVVKRFDEDPRVVALRKKLKTTRDGALLTLPLAGGVLQAETIYGSSVQPGQAKAFVATFGGAIGYGPTLAAAITDISRPHATKPAANASESSVALVREANALLAKADAALAKNDLTQYQKDVDMAKALLEKALRDPAWKAPTASSSASPSSGATP